MLISLWIPTITQIPVDCFVHRLILSFILIIFKLLFVNQITLESGLCKQDLCQDLLRANTRSTRSWVLCVNAVNSSRGWNQSSVNNITSTTKQNWVYTNCRVINGLNAILFILLQCCNFSPRFSNSGTLALSHSGTGTLHYSYNYSLARFLGAVLNFSIKVYIIWHWQWTRRQHAEHGLSWPRNGQAQKKLINWFVSV